jgi:RND family efflux transporter MFP subunit
MIATHYLTGLIFISLTVALAPCATGQEMEQEQMPLADVVVSKVTTGTIAPEGEFIGTVYYLEVSDIPSEVNGTVEIITFEEGERKREGELLIKLDSTLLEKNLQTQVALYEQVLSDLERARKDLERVENLYRKKMVAEKAYDDQRFQVKGLEKKSAALKAEVERLEIELEKTVINAPFDGVIIKKHIARGEWLSPGKTTSGLALSKLALSIGQLPC